MIFLDLTIMVFIWAVNIYSSEKHQIKNHENLFRRKEKFQSEDISFGGNLDRLSPESYKC